MNRSCYFSRIGICFVFLGLALFGKIFIFPSSAVAHPILKKYIIEYNLEALEKSLSDDSYRGEEGILRLNPETAKKLGIKVSTNEDYQASMRLFKEADKALEKARKAMTSRKKVKTSEYYEKRIAENIILFKESTEAAQKKLLNYRSSLNPEIDERFDIAICDSLIDRILEESLSKADNRLRDGLGYFYNISQGINGKAFPLTTENIRFVNYVFNEFLECASEEDIGMFDLDRDSGYRTSRLHDDWKSVAGSEISKFITLIETAIEKCSENIYDVDPLLFVCLIKKESDFNALSVSYVGAAGLTQIMPATAKDMGMENIHMPEYFNDAVSLMREERETRSQAMAVLFQITEKNKLQYAKKARSLMQESLDLGQKREKLFNRYKKELLGDRTDERLDPAKAIEYGLIYFAKLMKAQKGDISLALASYNAGPHRVKEYKGIPPYNETVTFRNRILKYYRDYLGRVRGK
ncbi:lytic transglycosylase domain-containing protein [Deltaproteobacteria bacterium]|nr:lytic transglycosylase domain-containing protein [Deltaproteobacteria bacterium]